MAKESSFLDGLRVVVVEDEAIIAEEIVTRLKHLGCRIVGVADNAQAAVASATETTPDLILMDIRLKGGVDGIEAARVIHERLNIPVVFVTAYSDPATLERAKIASPFGYVLKPITETGLMVAMEMALAHHRRERLFISRTFTDSVIVAHTPDAVVTVDLNSVIGSWNPAAERLFGYTAQEAIGRSIAILALPGQYPEQARLISEVSQNQSMHVHETTRRRKDGSFVEVRLHLSPIKDEHGAAIGVVAVSHDITSVKAMEQVLRRREAFLDMSEKAGKIGHWELEPSTGRLTYSSEMYRIHGLLPGEFESTLESALAMVHPGDRDRVGEAHRRVLESRQAAEAEYRIVRPDGAVRTVWARGDVILGDAGEILRVIGACRDITDRIALEEELRHSKKMESLGSLVGGVAHDFNNLLTVINGRSALLLDKLHPGDPLRADVAQIQGAGDRAATLVKQLLTFSRKQPLALQPLDLNQLVRQSSAMLASIAGENVELIVESSASPAPIMADPALVDQILINLTANARDAMPHGGRAAIAIAHIQPDAAFSALHPDIPPGPYVRLTVTDTGKGIGADIRERVFDPFFTTKENGTGLGLATVYGIVRQFGGAISIASEPDRGATFHIYLPRATSIAAAAPDAALQAQPLRGAETILVVEDQPDVRALVAGILEKYGYRVLAAEGGVQALAEAKSHSGAIDLLLTDMMMPGMRGTALAYRLRTLRPQIRVLYMSGYSSGSIEPGAVFVPKPFKPETLAAKVREALDS